MSTYISLLRGINVSGQKLVKMDRLRAMYENLGFSDVRTYLQSGNIIFKSHETDLVEKIELEIKNEFGFEVFVQNFTVSDWEKIVLQLPFQSADIESIYITLLEKESDDSNFSKILEKKADSENIEYKGKVIYFHCPDGYGKTKLSNNFIESKLKLRATTRNWKTTSALWGMVKND